MPIPGARYRTVQTKKGPVRLAYKGNKVVEAKNLKTGATHSPSEFFWAMFLSPSSRLTSCQDRKKHKK